jgi:hypothetical protein
LSAAAVEPWGVTVLKPPVSEGDGDLFIYDDLGMMGIPCVPATRLDKSMRSVFVPVQGMADPNTGKVVADILASGGGVIVTHAALERMSDNPALMALFGYAPATTATARTDVHAFEIDGKQIDAPKPFHVPGNLQPDEATKTLAWVICGTWGKLRVPFITVKEQPGGGKAVVWNLDTFGQDAYTIDESLCVPVKSELLTLPEAVISLLRNSALATLNVSIEAPPRVATFLFAKHAVFMNYTSAPAEIRVEGIALAPDKNASASVKESDKTDGSDKAAPPKPSTAIRVGPGAYAMLSIVP